MTTTHPSKPTLRRALLLQRRALPTTTLSSWSLALSSLLSSFPPLRSAHRIASFYPLPNELNLLSLPSSLPLSSFVFPRCEAHSLVFAPASPASPSDWLPGPMGLREPSSPAVDTHSIDWMLIPALACDSFGTRLGFGAGFYDRFLAAAPPLLRLHTIGIITPNAWFTQLPRDPWDIPLAFVATPEKIITI